MSKIPCFDQKKSSLNMLQLTQLAKDLNIDVPAKMSKRNLCVKLNSLQSAEQAKIIDEKLKLLKNDASREPTLKKNLIDAQTSEKPIIITDEQLTNTIAPKNNFETANLQLYRAVLSNDLESAKDAVNHGASVNLIRHWKIQPGQQQQQHSIILDDVIHNAHNTSFEMFTLLIDQGAKFSKSDGGRMLYNAVYFEKKDIVKHLLEHGAVTTFTHPVDNWSSVFVALNKKPDGNFRDLEVLALLIKHGADINQEANGFSPLLFAVRKNNYRAVELLLENCAKVTNDAFVDAKEKKNFEIAELLSKYQQAAKCEKNRPQTADVETIVFPTGDISSVDESDVSFAGTEINDLVAISYFLHHYRHVCVPNVRNIEWYCSSDVCHRLKTAEDVIAKVKRCQLNAGVRFIIGFISLQAPGRGHANAYVVDTKDTDTSGNNIVTAEIFEPHGSVSETFFEQQPYKLAVRNFFTNDLKVDRLFFSDEFCPNVGVQAWQDAEMEPKKKFDPLGFCSAWAIWWIHYRLENSTFPRDVLAHQANIHFLKQKKDISITTFIRNYSFFIAKYRKVVIENSCKNLAENFRDYENRINRVAQLRHRNDTLHPILLSLKATQSEFLEMEKNTSELQELGKKSGSDRWIVDVLTNLIAHPLTNFPQ